jgi:mannan endo-1,4-beta-mannosidase
VCTLANQLPDYGGTAHFTPQGEHFFTSVTAARRYQNQVHRLLQYRGASGRRIADSGAILAWDLINEPRMDGVEPAGAAAAWAESMSRFVGSLDQEHLITIGAEGFTDGYPANSGIRGTTGTEFASLCGVPTITLCSGHLYPKYLSDPSGATVSNVADLVHSWRVRADKLNKPILMGEVGYSLNDGGAAASRAKFYRAAGDAIKSSEVDGALLWNLGARADSSFTLQYGDRQSNKVLRRWVTALH